MSIPLSHLPKYWSESCCVHADPLDKAFFFILNNLPLSEGHDILPAADSMSLSRYRVDVSLVCLISGAFRVYRALTL